jgi:signal transduction histidine kinase/DNA-binding response OmpR family regulator
MTLLNANGGSTDNVICAIGENREHNIWVTNERSLARITVSKEKDGTWGYFVTSYSSIDGLQDRVFNQRSIKLLRDGNMVVGGQDGLNIIPPQPRQRVANTAKALFAGIVLFDHPIQVGEEYDGHVVIDKDINEIRELELTSKEKDFTILLASSEVSLPQKARFLYRLDGFSDKWLLTQEDQSSLTFTSLPAGHYTLNVRVVDRNGVVGKDISSLNITILPPPYLSTWAILIYLIILAFVIYQGRKIIIRRQLARYKLEQSKREVARIKEMEEMKLNFFTNVSHELRTPLMLIISPLQALIKKENEPEKHKTLELILRNAERLLQMVGQILDFRKIEKDKEQLNLVSGDFVVYISHIVANFKALGGKDTSIEFRSNISSLIMAFDADKIRKIVDNLLSNAMKFTPDGGRITVAVNLRNNTNASDKAMMEIVVADNGTGIRDEDKKHIFERFYMGSNKNPYGGSGVGLSIAHDFAVLHGGDITVADNKGGGTIFTVTIPVRHDPSLQANDVDAADKLKVDIKDAFVDNSSVADTHEPKNESDAQKDRVEQKDESKKETSGISDTVDDKQQENDDNESVESNEKDGKKKQTVLIVDDSTDFLDFFSNELSQHFNVLTAENGRQALDRISEHKPDLIISDVMMPVMDGNELCKAVKGNKRTADIPFIMLTARLAQEHQIEGLANGADDYVTKPFNLEMLYMRIHNLLKWHNAVPDKQQNKIEPKLKHIEITSLDKQLVNDATKYVDDNISDTTLNVESMAKALGMSRVQLYKRLLPVTGSTPTEFIREIRLRRAEQLLRESQLSISEVAYRVGFNNPRYFSKYFKEMYGVMPSQYKK